VLLDECIRYYCYCYLGLQSLKNMKIGIDVDGVLACFTDSFCELMVSVTNRNLWGPARPVHIPSWDFPEYYGYTVDEVKAAFQWIAAQDFWWTTLPGYPDTYEAMLYLRKRSTQNDHLYFITDRAGATAKTQTEKWIQQWGIINPTVLISKEKGLCARALALDAYIDDRWENVVDVVSQSPTTHVVLMAQSWNLEPWRLAQESPIVRSIPRVESVVGFADNLP